MLHKKEMQIGTEDWITCIRQGAVQLGVKVTSQQATQFAQHAQLLMDWNQKINLTAITAPMEVAVKHFLDSIAPLYHLTPDAYVLDIGTGGGFPGIPLKIMRPQQHFVLIDALRKKISFVRHVMRELGLMQITALQVRAEDLACQPEHQGRYGVIVCRALADIPVIVRLAEPLLMPEGCILAWKGPGNGFVASETDDNRKIVQHTACEFAAAYHTYQLPFMNDYRTLVSLQMK